MILKVSKISIEIKQPQVKVKYTYSGASLLRQFGYLSIREILRVTWRKFVRPSTRTTGQPMWNLTVFSFCGSLQPLLTMLIVVNWKLSSQCIRGPESDDLLFKVNYEFTKESFGFSLFSTYTIISNLCSVQYPVVVVIKLVKWSVEKRLPTEHGVTYQMTNAMLEQARNHPQAWSVTQSLVLNGESSIRASVVEVISLTLCLCYIVLCAVWLSEVIRRLCSRPNVRWKSQVYHLLFRDEFQLCSHRLLQRQAQRNKASSRDDRKSSKQHQLVPYERNSDEMR